jgi:HlyD family secretion protein
MRSPAPSNRVPGPRRHASGAGLRRPAADLGQTAASRFPALPCLLLLLSCEPGGDKPEYRSEPVTEGDLLEEVVAVGTVQPVSLTQVSSQLSGQVAEVLVEHNDPVEKGQTLARLDQQSYQARLAEAEAELEVARSELRVRRAGILRAGARLDNRQAEREVSAAETRSAAARLRLSEAELQRTRALNKLSSASAKQLDQARSERESADAQQAAAQARLRVQESAVAEAEADLAIAEAQVENAEALIRKRTAAVDEARFNLQRTLIRSPLDGVVIDRDVEAGQTVAASLQAPTLFTLAGDLGSIQVKTRVDEADIGRIAKGQIANFRVDAFPSRAFDGVVRDIQIAPRLVQNVVTYNVLVKAANTDRALLPGMTAMVRIIVARHRGLLLPNAALRFIPPDDWSPQQAAFSNQRVWLAGPDGPKPVPVSLGPGNQRSTLLADGALSAGSRLITALKE